MSQQARESFLILLTELEKITHEENFAIRQADFSYLEEIVPQKEALLSNLVAIRDQANIEHKQDLPLHQRIEKLKIQQADNNQLMSNLIEENQQQQQMNLQEHTKLKSVRGAYGAKVTSLQTATAHQNLEA